MMKSKKVMKETPKRDETVIPDDTHIGIGINTLPEPGRVEFDEFYSPETAVLTSTATDSKFVHDDDDVLVRFSQRYIGTTPEISSTGRLGEETGSIGSQTVKKKLFLDHTVADSSNGRNTDGCSGHSKPKMATPDVLYDSNMDCNHHSCNQIHVLIGFGCSGKKSKPPSSGFTRLVDDIGTSEVNCSRNGICVVKAVPTDGNSSVGYCGIDDLPPAGTSARMTETVVMHQGIFLKCICR
jgi:hypothetical protein